VSEVSLTPASSWIKLHHQMRSLPVKRAAALRRARAAISRT
jgi:hypothetical protein